MQEFVYHTPVTLSNIYEDPTSTAAPQGPNGFTLYDPASVLVSIIRDDNTLAITAVPATRNSQGKYSINFVIDRNPRGTVQWKARWDAGPSNVIEIPFTVHPSPFP